MLASGTLAPRPTAFRPFAGGARFFPLSRLATPPRVVSPAVTDLPAGEGSGGEGIVEVDREGRITYVSLSAQRLLGWGEADLVGRSLLTLTGVSSGRALSHGSMLLNSVRQGRRLGIGDVELVCKDRTRRPVTCTVSPRLTDGVVSGAAFAFTDSAARRAQSAALYDALTGLPGQSLLQDRLQQAVRQANREMRPLAVLVLDLAGFRRLNATYGHQAGDRVLQAVGQRLAERVRPTDTVARLGEDAFAVVLPGVSEDGARCLAQSLVAALSVPVELDGGAVPVAAHAGVASYPREAGEALLASASAAEAVARRTGEPVAVAGVAAAREPALVA